MYSHFIIARTHTYTHQTDTHTHTKHTHTHQTQTYTHTHTYTHREHTHTHYMHTQHTLHAHTTHTHTTRTHNTHTSTQAHTHTKHTDTALAAEGGGKLQISSYMHTALHMQVRKYRLPRGGGTEQGWPCMRYLVRRCHCHHCCHQDFGRLSSLTEQYQC